MCTMGVLINKILYMENTTMWRISSRIDKDLQNKGNKIFLSLGIKPSHAITMFYAQVVNYWGIPFDLKVPNAHLLAAFKEGEHPENLSTYDSAEEALDDILNW